MSDPFLYDAVDRTLELPGVSQTLLERVGTKRLRLEPGERVHTMGDEVTSLYCVVSGWMTTVCDLITGERQLLNFHRPYDLVGFEYLGRSTAVSDLVAWERSEIITLPIPDFKDALAESREASAAVTSMVSRKYAALQTRLTVFSKAPALSKLIHLLHGLRARQIRKGDLDYNVLRVPLTQQDIADTIGLTNVSISRLFTKLEAIGCVRFERHVITILDYDLMMAQTAGLSDDFNPVDEFD